jgi:hypothetical protein
MTLLGNGKFTHAANLFAMDGASITMTCAAGKKPVLPE